MARAYYLIPIFGLSTLALYLLSLQAPSTRSDDEQVALRFPSDIESLQLVARSLNLYAERNWWYVIVLFGCAYIYKQAFCIPGSGILNVLAGALYGQYGGTFFVCIFTAVGACVAYFLSKTFLKDALRGLFPGTFRSFEEKVENNRDRLLYFMIFIRVVPVSPGWAINQISPLINVPLTTFFFTTLIGLIPYNFLGVSAGVMITSLKSVSDIITTKTFFTLLMMAGVALGPAFLLKRNNITTTKQE